MMEIKPGKYLEPIVYPADLRKVKEEDLVKETQLIEKFSVLLWSY